MDPGGGRRTPTTPGVVRPGTGSVEGREVVARKHLFAAGTGRILDGIAEKPA